MDVPVSIRTILQRIQRLLKREDEPPSVKERYPLDIKEAMQSQFEKGRQSVLKEQAGIGGINVLEAMHKKFQAGIQAGMRLNSPRCGQGHLLGAMKEQAPGVFISICGECSRVEQRTTRVLNLPIGQWTKIWKHSPEATQILPAILKKTDAPETL